MVEPNDGQIDDSDDDGLTALGALSARCTDSPAAVVRMSTLKHITSIVPSARSSHALTPILPWRARRVLVDSTGQLRWLQSPRTTGASRCTADTLWCAPYTLTQHVTRFARSALRGCAMPLAKRSSAPILNNVTPDVCRSRLLGRPIRYHGCERIGAFGALPRRATALGATTSCSSSIAPRERHCCCAFAVARACVCVPAHECSGANE